MTPDAIRTALEQAAGLPREALAAAVANADSLAPAVLNALDQAVAGVHLLPDQENLLFFGLHALSAARHTAAFPGLARLLRRPETELDRLFGDALTQCGTQLLLGLYDGDEDALYALVEDGAAHGWARWAGFQVLARLVWEGRAGRPRLLDLLDRFDRDDMAPLQDAAWEGWADAVCLLGLAEFESRVRRSWAAGRHAPYNDAEGEDWLRRLNDAVTRPEDPTRFENDFIVAMGDPVAALAWLDHGKDRKSVGRVNDPAGDSALSIGELDWLDGFLSGSKVPVTTLNLEQLDGFFCALEAGPKTVPMAEALPRIWDSEDAPGPVFDSPRQAEFVTALLARHRETVRRRLAAKEGHSVFLYGGPPEEAGKAGSRASCAACTCAGRRGSPWCGIGNSVHCSVRCSR